MSSAFQIARKSRIKNAQLQLTVLREVADRLPDRASDRSPLGDQCRKWIGWLGVLARWKMAPAYCKAILSHEHASILTARPPNR
jgi:hypothetical protein